MSSKEGGKNLDENSTPRKIIEELLA